MQKLHWGINQAKEFLSADEQNLVDQMMASKLNSVASQSGDESAEEEQVEAEAGEVVAKKIDNPE